MTVLALMRHAKAVKDDPGGDHARALSESGRDAAAAAGLRLRALLSDTVLVVASDARRTWQTAELAFPEQGESRFWLEPNLYAAGPETLLRFARSLPSDVPEAVLVGHNPGISELASLLAGEGEAADLARVAEGLATADAVILSFEGGWADIAPMGGRLTAMLARKDAED